MMKTRIILSKNLSVAVKEGSWIPGSRTSPTGRGSARGKGCRQQIGLIRLDLILRWYCQCEESREEHVEERREGRCRRARK